MVHLISGDKPSSHFVSRADLKGNCSGLAEFPGIVIQRSIYPELSPCVALFSGKCDPRDSGDGNEFFKNFLVIIADKRGRGGEASRARPKPNQEAGAGQWRPGSPDWPDLHQEK